jgi:DUF1680 family protein
VDMLRLTGNPLVADELELATFNGLLGAQSASGRWWTYNTPMDGVRRASAHDSVFQAAPGSPELNCCSVNGPRGLGMLTEWAVMTHAEGPVVNYYGPGLLGTVTPSGQELVLREDTAYPVEGVVRVKVRIEKPEEFVVRMRIPAWSVRSGVVVNGEAVEGVEPGTYLRLEREWKDGDVVELRLDMSPHYWMGEREAEGKASVYRGPILLAYDPRFNTMDAEELPTLDAGRLTLEPVTWEREPRPWVLFRARSGGGEVLLCDFATAGAAGNPYRTWLPMTGLEPLEFSRERSVWNNRR